MSYDGVLRDLHTVEFKRLIPGPIELAWEFLTKREKLKTWFADVTLEPRLGGAVDVHFDPDTCGGCSAGVRGVVREFRPPHVVAFSWIQRRAQPDGSMQDRDEGEVRFELAERGDKVLLTLLHSRLSTDELTSHSAGWHAYLQNLESLMSGNSRIDFMAVAGRVRPGYEAQLAGLQRAGAA
ncbi:MAG TPA: SRPBCC family protein [Dongiaceae bacterium]|nr:SRPBCC family protein [Dongiaceae bacterium]